MKDVIVFIAFIVLGIGLMVAINAFGSDYTGDDGKLEDLNAAVTQEIDKAMPTTP